VASANGQHDPQRSDIAGLVVTKDRRVAAGAGPVPVIQPGNTVDDCRFEVQDRLAGPGQGGVGTCCGETGEGFCVRPVQRRCWIVERFTLEADPHPSSAPGGRLERITDGTARQRVGCKVDPMRTGDGGGKGGDGR
jgi:hypothetical protein